MRRTTGLLLFAVLHASAVAAKTVDVTITSTPSFAFLPRNVTVRSGDTVRWTNADGTHNVLADDGTFTSGSPSSAPFSFSRAFLNVGSFPYYCQPHGGNGGTGQSGAVVVLDAVELTPGAAASDDLDGGRDLYRLGQKPYESYEAVLDSVAGNPVLLLDRVDTNGTTVLQSSLAVSPTIGQSRTLSFENGVGVVENQRLRVSCPTCARGDVYSLRLLETTLTVPRFNQSGSQFTILILQNTGNDAVAGHLYFWNATGVLLNAGGTLFNIAAHGAAVVSGATIPALSGQSGTITITHDGRHGALSGKAVALEPSTGFTFDTPVLPPPR